MHGQIDPIDPVTAIGAQNIFHLTVPYVFQVSSLESYIAAFQSMRVA